MISEISVPGRWCLGAAAAVAAGVALPWWIAATAGLMIVILSAAGRVPEPAAVLGVLVIAGSVSGLVATARQSSEIELAPSGASTFTGTVVADPISEWDDLAVVRPSSVHGQRWRGPELGARPLPAVRVGDVVEVVARLQPGERRVRSRVVAGTLRVDDVVAIRPSSSPVLAIGNGLRERVRTTFEPTSATRALVTGLLIGDTSEVPAPMLGDLRRAGLSHYVAVSGSNVALFLGVWWILGAPLAIHPRLRVAYGVFGLAVFAVATRFEPSVIRASVMAAVPLVGGFFSIPVDPWMALGIAVALVLLVSAELISSVGFLLSVLATVGVLIGVTGVRTRRPRWFWFPLGATIGAQIAVAPLLLTVFGSIPLVAPLTNLVAGPVVALTTGLGLASVVVPLPILVSVTTMGASLLVSIAQVGALGPQLGVGGVVATIAAGSLLAVRGLRPLGMAAVAIGVMWSVGAGASWPSSPTVVVLDVGQGDAILLQDPSGVTMLVDGGRDPRVLEAALRRHGVREVDLAVVTHGDADHVGGLVELVGADRIDAVWVSPFAPIEGLFSDLLSAAEATATPVVEVHATQQLEFGSFTVDVIAPARRFASDNDGSIVLLVSAGRSILLPGDIGAVAQRELPEIQPDVMVVPHHGAATTDLAWLSAINADLAVLSYGENRFGH
nr:ComEC/Rec2 family competence protein [Acidimicrobiia bacterium]